MKLAPSFCPASGCAFAALLVLGAATNLRAEIEFSGYLKAEGVMKFTLSDPALKQKSDLLAIGGVFDGYTVIGFDAKREVLAVEKAGTTTQLPLKPGAVQRVIQTEESLLNSPYTLGPRLEERPRVELFGPDRSALTRRASELDNAINQVPLLDLSSGGSIRILDRPISVSSSRARASGGFGGPAGSGASGHPGGAPTIMTPGRPFTVGGGADSKVRLVNSSGATIAERPAPAGTPREQLRVLSEVVQRRTERLQAGEAMSPDAQAALDGVWRQIREIEQRLENQSARPKAAP